MTDQPWNHDPASTREEGRDIRRAVLGKKKTHKQKFAVERHETDLLTNYGMYPTSSRRPPRRSDPPKINGHASKKPGYNGKVPLPEAAEPLAVPEMRDPFDIEVKKTKAENLARGKPRLPVSHQLATYKALVQTVDLLNPKLPEDERLRRSRRLLQAYARVRERRPKFHDDSPELRLARSLINRFQYQQRLKRNAAPTLAAG